MVAHPDKRQYIQIALFLGALTAIEVVLFYLEDTIGAGITRPTLILLSALKFVIVIGWYMHARFEKAMIRGFFTAGFVLAGALYAFVIVFGFLEGPVDDGKFHPVAGVNPVTLEVQLVDFDIVPASIDVPAGADLTLTITNGGDAQHNFLINGEYGTSRLKPGDVRSLHVGAISEPILAWCTIPGHRDLGMEIELVPQLGT